jgi:hypothetical protein
MKKKAKEKPCTVQMGLRKQIKREKEKERDERELDFCVFVGG